ncbi:hypothetical protein ABIE67_005803 [Streptomyces sp. V4I8]|uniref:hypothetical protein n=1 Tax=Streptomyces sp. V4I8 TaxID=3156469 RepID=UPI003517B264
MADEQYRWLDRETAERLLRGESLEAVDAADRDQAERLAKTLEALTVEPSLSSAELPGEAAALAAFRAARADRDGAAATVGPDAGPHATHVADVGLVRIGGPARAARRPRWGRPVRLGLAAALAVGMVGGVAVAAGTGVLRAPFVEDEGGRPAASVSAPASPERPFLSPSPESGVRGGPTPDDDTRAPAAPGVTDDVPPGGPATDRGSAPDDRAEPSGGRWQAATSYCRDLRDGKQLSNDRRRTLENAAGGSGRVREYCQNVLKTSGGGSWDTPGKDKSKDGSKDRVRGREKDDDEGDGAGAGRDGRGGRYAGGDRDGHRDSDRDGHRVDGTALAPSAVTGLLPDRVITPLAHR